MCFTTLPPELQEEIIIDLEKPDLYSLCLVSKSLLHLARPLLYRSIDLFLDRWQRKEAALWVEMAMTREEDPHGVVDVMRIEFAGRERRQNKVIETLEAHQDWKGFTQVIRLRFAESVEGKSESSKLGQLLSSCHNLQTLVINSAYDDATGAFLLQHIPPSLRSLDLEHSQLTAAFNLRLLQNLPHLEALVLANDHAEGLFPLVPNQSIPRLDCLRSVALRHPFRSPSFFSAVASSTKFLSTLAVDFIAVQALLPERLSTLTRLTISGELQPSNRRYGDYSKDLASKLVGVFRGCQSLQYLKMASSDMMGSDSVVQSFETSRLLHHLSETLQTLVLSSIDFGSVHLADFLSSPPEHLYQFECSRFPRGGHGLSLGLTSFDEEGEDKIEEICEARGICLRWLGGRVKGQRDDGLSVAVLQEVMAAFSNLA